MYEHKSEPLLSPRAFARRIGISLSFAAAIVGFALAVGTLGYHFIAGLAWIDALLNAAMILTGMGPVDTMRTHGSKLFATFYALFSGVMALTAGAFIVGPVLHRMFHAMHLEETDDEDG